MSDNREFVKEVIFGVVMALIIGGLVAGLEYLHNRDKELIEYAEKQIEVDALREDYINRDPLELLDEVPGVRRAADGAAAGFDRELDEILYKFRNRFIDW